MGGWVGPRAGLDPVEKRQFVTLPGLRPLCCPARNQSLYRLHSPGPCGYSCLTKWPVGRKMQNLVLLYLRSLAIVWLRLTESTRVTPVTRVTLGRGSNLGARSRPEPTIPIWRLKVGAVASVEVALTPRRPDITHVTCN
jgi:hypothetical protein